MFLFSTSPKHNKLISIVFFLLDYWNDTTIFNAHEYTIYNKIQRTHVENTRYLRYREKKKKLFRQFNQWQLIKIDLLNMQQQQQLAIMIFTKLCLQHNKIYCVCMPVDTWDVEEIKGMESNKINILVYRWMGGANRDSHTDTERMENCYYYIFGSSRLWILLLL